MLAEMVATEREYVRALDYTIENYFPELDRSDVPQGLRGQRAHLFGNLEKLRDFHCHFFLCELEACTRHPPRVAYAFLRHVSPLGHTAPLILPHSAKLLGTCLVLGLVLGTAMNGTNRALPLGMLIVRERRHKSEKGNCRLYNSWGWEEIIRIGR